MISKPRTTNNLQDSTRHYEERGPRAESVAPFYKVAPECAEAPPKPLERSAKDGAKAERPVRRGRTLEYHREWRKTPTGKASLRASQRAFQARHPERVAANSIVGAAVRSGRLEKGPCELAGSACKGRIEAHHDDYTKPLEVRWLCKSHHKAADRARRRAEAA